MEPGSTPLISLVLLAALLQAAHAQQQPATQASSTTANTNHATLLTPVPSTGAANNVGKLNRQPSISPRNGQFLRIEIASLKLGLEEFRQGKRSDSDGFYLLWRIMADMNSLGQMDTPEWKAMLEEWKGLKLKHPEFATHPPMALEGAKNAEVKAALDRQQRASDLASKRARPFVPKDTMIINLLGYDHHAIFVYQYHLEFYHLPSSVELEQQRADPRAAMQLYDDGRIIYPDSIRDLNLQPFKIMTFRHHIETSGYPYGPTRRFIWVCDNILDQYVGADVEEGLILGNKGTTWQNKSAETQDFCGALSVDGRIIYQLPIRQHVPDTAIIIGAMNPDGTSIELRLAEVVTQSVSPGNYENDDSGLEIGGTVHYIGNSRQVLIYTYPDNLERFNISDKQNIIRAFKDHTLQWDENSP